MSYREMIEAEQRLLLLRTLLDDPDRSANERILRRALATYGHALGEDAGRRVVQWLADAGCVKVEDLSGLWVVTLTTRGAEVVRAETTVPGIAHPMDVGCYGP